MIVVMVVVTIVTAGAALAAIAPTTAVGTTAAGGVLTASAAGAWTAGLAVIGGGAGLSGAVIAAAAIGGAVGSIASQVVGIATGVQSKFSWGQVALSAIGSGVTAGVGGSGLAASVGIESQVGAAMFNAAVGSTITQGVGVAMGLQDKFNWRAVAAASVSAGVGAAIGGGKSFGENFARRLVTGTIYQAIANKGKINFAAVAADAFGNAIGGAFVGQMFKSEQAERLVQTRNAVMEAAAPAAPEGAGYLGGIKLKDSWRFAPGLDNTANADYSAGYWGKQSYSLTGSGATGDLYTTQKGDSLARIAGEKLGDETLWPLIARANGIPIEKAGMLPLGKEIVIPPKDGANLDSARAMAGAYSKWDAANKQALAAQAATKAAPGLNDYLFGYSDSKANPNLVCGPDWTLEKNYARVAMPEVSGQSSRHSIGGWDGNSRIPTEYAPKAWTESWHGQAVRSTQDGLALAGGEIVFGAALAGGTKLFTSLFAYEARAGYYGLELGGGATITGAAGARVSVANSTSRLSYDISKWGEYGLPSDGYFARTLNPEQYRAFAAGREFSFGGKPVEGYPSGMGFIGSAEEVSGLTTAQGYREGLKLGYNPKYVLEFQLRDPAGLQNVIKAPYAEFKYGGETGAGFKEWNYPGISSSDFINSRLRILNDPM